jgi:hypothetical protein
MKKDKVGKAPKREKRNANKVLVRKLEGNRLLDRSTHRLGDNIKMDIKEFVWVGVCKLDSFGPGEELVAGFCQHGNELRISINCGNFCD